MVSPGNRTVESGRNADTVLPKTWEHRGEITRTPRDESRVDHMFNVQ